MVTVQSSSFLFYARAYIYRVLKDLIRTHLEALRRAPPTSREAREGPQDPPRERAPQPNPRERASTEGLPPREREMS